MSQLSPESLTGAINHSENQRPENEDEQCGCEIGCGTSRRCVVKSLKCCTNSKGFLFFICLATFVHGAVVNGLMSIVISTLEKRFALRSWETGLIVSCYDIGMIVSIPVVTYVGGRGHRPLWVGWGMLISGIGSIIFSFPHFIIPKYVVPDSLECNALLSSNCTHSSLRPYRGFFIVGQLLNGVGASPLYTLAVTYLDANVKQASSALYNGVFFAVTLLGPGIGFLIGGLVLAIFTNLGETVTVTSQSPLWVGNWWIGFLIGGILSALLSIPIIMFPRQLPGTEKLCEDRNKEIHKSKGSESDLSDSDFGRRLKDAPRCALVLLRVPVLTFTSISAAMEIGLLSAVATFSPKYIEEMFTISTSKAALYLGVVTILGAGSAHLLGGFLVTKFRMDVVQMLKLSFIFSTASLGFNFVFLIRCQNRQFAGINVPYNDESSVECRSLCGCSTAFFNPVCGKNGLTYTSFCDAGCSPGDSLFLNCTRISFSSVQGAQNNSAVLGRCPHVTPCHSVSLFLVFIGLTVFFAFLKAQASLQVSLRSVRFVQRSFAIGLQWMIIRLLGNIPLPIIMGKLLDLSCMVWSLQCDECGSCKVYDNPFMSTNITVMSTSTKVINLGLILLAWWTYRAPQAEEQTSRDYEKKTESNSRRESKTRDVALVSYENTAYVT